MIEQDRLTRAEFKEALHAGRGKALIHVRKYGLEGVSDIVLEACLIDMNHDRQCENSRAPWLFEMIKEDKLFIRLSKTILSVLNVATDYYDLQQLCDLAALMAKNKNDNAACGLREFVLNQALGEHDEWCGVLSLSSLGEMSDLIELSRRLGQSLSVEPDKWVYPIKHLVENHPDSIGEIKELAKQDKDIRTYLEWSKQEDLHEIKRRGIQEDVRDRVRNEYPLQMILKCASDKKWVYPARYGVFGRFATQEELLVVLERLAFEHEEEICLRLLWIFHKTPLPELHPKVFELVRSRNHDIRSAALMALSRTCDLRVGELARELLSSEEFCSNVLRLFILNYQPEDEKLILAAVKKLSVDRDQAFYLGRNIIDIVEHNPLPAFFDLLMWAYENTSTSYLRLNVIKTMISIHVFNFSLAHECLYDANKEIQKIAREWLNLNKN